MSQGFRGISFPFRFNGIGGVAGSSVETDNPAHIIESIRQIIGTHRGERVMRPEFGADADDLVFSPQSNTGIEWLCEQIETTMNETSIPQLQLVEQTKARRGRGRSCRPDMAGGKTFERLQVRECRRPPCMPHRRFRQRRPDRTPDGETHQHSRILVRKVRSRSPLGNLRTRRNAEKNRQRRLQQNMPGQKREHERRQGSCRQATQILRRGGEEVTVSRNQFDEAKNWTEPEWQEGVPVMDADLNLAMKIGKTGLRRAVCDFLGNGSPNDGFMLSGDANDPTIHTGVIWVAGLKIELPEDIPVSTQPNAPVAFPDGDGLWYLDVYECLLTNADDPAIRDSRLPANVDTPIKVWKTCWTIRKVTGASLPTPEPDHYYIGIALETSGIFTDIRNKGMVIAGADTGFQNRVGGRPGSGHHHNDEDIDVANSNFTGDNLDEVLNEIDSRIEVVEDNIGVVPPHAASHGSVGSDPVDIASLAGQCTQSQISPSHSGIHEAPFNDGLPISPDVDGNTSLGEHLSDATIHRKYHNDLLLQQGGSPTERYHLDLDLYNAAAGATGANAGNGNTGRSHIQRSETSPITRRGDSCLL